MTYHRMVRETVKETCPAIDRMQEMIKELFAGLKSLDDETEISPDNFERASDLLHDMTAHCELLRSDNTKLRAIACEALGRADKEQQDSLELLAAARAIIERINYAKERSQTFELWSLHRPLAENLINAANKMGKNNA